jgi:hypothetical protein
MITYISLPLVYSGDGGVERLHHLDNEAGTVSNERCELSHGTPSCHFDAG